MKFNTNRGFGFGAMPGFNRRKIGSISNGDWDRDGVKNRVDCNAMNWKKQDGGEPFQVDMDDEPNFKLMRTYAPGERELIQERLERARLKKKMEGNR